MSELEMFLRTYGLWALFFAAAFEGDIALLLAGMLIHLQVWPAAKALAVGAAGGLSGDALFFWLGQGQGRRWLTTAHGRRVIPRMDRFAHRYGLLSLFAGRYIYGARVATMFYWGMRGLKAWRFLILDALNCCIWVALFCGAGYWFSSSLESWIGRLHVMESWLLIGLLVFMAVLGIRYYWVEISPLPQETNGNGAGPPNPTS